MPNQTTTLDYSHGYRSGQACDWEQGHTVSGRKVRITIHHDRSYAVQSTAKAELWTGSGWVPMATYHYGQWAEYTNPDGDDWLTEGMSQANLWLFGQALDLLA